MRKRKFEELFIPSVNNSLVEEGTEASALTFQHSFTTHILLEVKVAPTTGSYHTTQTAVRQRITLSIIKL